MTFAYLRKRVVWFSKIVEPRTKLCCSKSFGTFTPTNKVFGFDGCMLFTLGGKDCWTWRHGRDDHPIFKNLMKLRDSLIIAIGSVQNSINLLNSWLQNDKFCTESTYDWLKWKMDKNPWMRLIWKVFLPPKHSFILWLAFRSRLNSKDSWFLKMRIQPVFSAKGMLKLSPIFFSDVLLSPLFGEEFGYGLRRNMGGALIKSNPASICCYGVHNLESTEQFSICQ